MAPMNTDLKLSRIEEGESRRTTVVLGIRSWGHASHAYRSLPQHGSEFIKKGEIH
jgi:hypothetical protein